MKLVAVLIVIMLSGCVSGKMTVDQAGKCEFEYSSFWKDVSSPELDLCGATMSAGSSAANDKILGAVLNAISK